MSSFILPSSESSSEDSYPLIETIGKQSRTKTSPSERHCARALSCFQPNFITIILCILVIYLLVSLRYTQSQCQGYYSYETGYNTDFVPARQAISMKKVKFSGGPYFDYNGTLHVTSNPNEPPYVGPPSKEIDDAWEALIHDRYLAITAEEAKGISENLWLNQEDGFYHAGMDVFHTLHCLNMLRMSQDLDYYIEKGNIEHGRNGRIHIDHCINHLRQIVQCHADMTPVPLVWIDIRNWPNGGREIPEFDQVHTCRDFSKLRDWSTERDHAVKEQSKVSS